MEYSINKGIGKNVEFKGLQAQYLIIFAVGLLGIFFLFAMLYLLSIPIAICIVLGLIASTILIFFTFQLNRKYGQHGLMKLAAGKTRPQFITNRKPIHQLFISISKEHGKHTKNKNIRE